VLLVAAMVKMGKSASEMAAIMWQCDDEAHKKKMQRLLKKYIQHYPRVFNALAR
jgi:hypothetical protein